MQAVPVFLSEIAPIGIRGGLNILFQLNVTIGILVQLVRYIRAPIALRYGTSGPRTSSFSSQGRYGSLLTFNDRTTVGTEMFYNYEWYVWIEYSLYVKHISSTSV